MNRAKFSLLLGTLLCCLLVPALPGTGLAQGLSKVAITYPIPGILSIDLYIAQARGFFHEEGLDAQLVMAGGNIAITAAMAGEAHAVSNVASTIRAIERGNIPFKVLSISVRRPVYWLTARPEIKSIADLKGKLYGTNSRGNAPHVATARLLRKAGLDSEKDITVIVTGNPFQSLVSGAIQAAALTPPQVILAREKFKMNILGSAMEEYLELARGIAVPEDLLREKRDLIKRILRAVAKSRRYVLENEKGSSEVLTDYLKVELPVALESYRLARPAFTTNGIPTEEEVREYLKAEAEAMGLPKPVSAERIFDFSLQREVNRELGIR